MNQEKQCGECKEFKAFGQFYTNKRGRYGLHLWCKECCRMFSRGNYKKKVKEKKEYAAEYRKTHREYARNYQLEYSKTEKAKAAHVKSVQKARRKYPEKYKARRLVGSAIQRGDLARMPCEKCGSVTRIQAHHADYTKPLDVIWLCHKHHVEIHLKK